MREMTRDERFFWTHAGYSWNPETETRAAGRRRCKPTGYVVVSA